MKFYCDKCNSKYAIADDKVRGKILKVRCKKCEHIITVREPTAPTPAAAPAPTPAPAPALTARANAPKLRPQRPAPIAWFYAINGQTFGPFDADLLCAKYTAGEVGDASYVWHEGFEGWKPALEVEPFASALRQGEALRPRHKTIGVSGAMEAISLADHARHEAREEEAGVAPSAAEPQPTLKALGRPHEPQQADGPSQDLSARLGALRSRLRESRPLDALPASAQAPPSAQPDPVDEDATQSSSRDSLAALLDQARAPQRELSEESSVAEEIASGETFALSATPSQADELPSFDHEDMFGEDSAVLDSPSEASLDFSMMEQPSHMRETSLHIDHRSDDDFAPSQSLLIQLGDIQRKGRKQRVAIGGAIAAVLVAVFGVGLVVWSQAGDQNRFAEPGSSERVAQKDDLVINRYKKNELMTFGVEERLDVTALAEELPAEPSAAEVKGGAAPRIRPLVVAQNDTAARKPGLGINTRDLIGQDNLNAALRDSNTRGANTPASAPNLRGSAQEGAPAALASAGNTPPRPKTGPDWDRLSAASPSAPMARAPLPELNKNRGVASSASALTKDQLREGFKAIRGSVGRCYQSHTRRGLPFDSPKVAVTVEVQGNGRVSKVSFVPSNLGYTEFGQCMDAQRARWSFPEFQGEPLKVEHTYVLQ